MDYLVADQIKTNFFNEIAKGEPFHSLHLLGHTKEEVVTAFKVSYIHMVKYQTSSKEIYDQEMFMLRNLNSFLDHEEYTKWNSIAQKEHREPQEIRELIRKQSEALKAPDGYNDVEHFIESIQKLDKNDPLFFQRAYTIAGLEYKPEYRVLMERSFTLEGLERPGELVNEKVLVSNDSAFQEHSIKEDINPEEKIHSSNNSEHKTLKNKNKKESILYFFIPHIIFIILVTITDNFEIAVALSAQAIASSTMLGFLLSLVLRKYKKYAYLIGSIVALLYPMMN